MKIKRAKICTIQKTTHKLLYFKRFGYEQNEIIYQIDCYLSNWQLHGVSKILLDQIQFSSFSMR